VLIFGNSGSGKSTLAKRLAKTENLAHLDLDILAWQPTEPPQRTALTEAKAAIEAFMKQNNSWVIEGCYTDLLQMAESQAGEIIYLNLSVAQCIQNAKNRPWEPHKYASKEEQDKNLTMLINWINDYTERSDEFSKTAHLHFYRQYNGHKTMITSNLPHSTNEE